MTLRWFDSHQPDGIDMLFSKINSTDLGLVWQFLVICGLWGATSWFNGHGFGAGFEKGIPLAACLLIYETCIRQDVRTAELRARLIEIDGKVTALEAASACWKDNQELQKIHKMLSHLHDRLEDGGDVGSVLGKIDTNVRELCSGLEPDELDSDLIL